MPAGVMYTHNTHNTQHIHACTHIHKHNRTSDPKTPICSAGLRRLKKGVLTTAKGRPPHGFCFPPQALHNARTFTALVCVMMFLRVCGQETNTHTYLNVLRVGGGAFVDDLGACNAYGHNIKKFTGPDVHNHRHRNNTIPIFHSIISGGTLHVYGYVHKHICCMYNICATYDMWRRRSRP